MAPRRNKRSEASRAIAQAIIDQYKPTNAEEMQDALKDIFGPMFEAMLQGEMDAHLGYAPNDHGSKGTDNRRNGYGQKSIKTTYGDVEIAVPETVMPPLIRRQFPKGQEMSAGSRGKSCRCMPVG